jgi:diguanylate cyclase (GGDEF)-like protein
MSDNQDVVTIPRVEWEQLKIANERLAALAITDALTGISNYLAFTDRLELLMAEAERGRQFAFIFIDIDNFKVFNDTYGHPAGDLVLKKVAQTLKERTRRVDFVARYGGEEFVVLLPDTDVVGAEILADRLREAVAEMTVSNLPQVTISLGICAYARGHAHTREGLVDCADKQLYAAKEGGRNQVHVCDHFKLDEMLDRDLEMVKAFCQRAKTEPPIAV